MKDLFLITERPGKESQWTDGEVKEKVPKCRKASSPPSKPHPENVAVHTGSNATEPVDISAAAGHAASPGLEQQQSGDTLETTGSCS